MRARVGTGPPAPDEGRASPIAASEATDALHGRAARNCLCAQPGARTLYSASKFPFRAAVSVAPPQFRAGLVHGLWAWPQPAAKTVAAPARRSAALRSFIYLRRLFSHNGLGSGRRLR